MRGRCCGALLLFAVLLTALAGCKAQCVPESGEGQENAIKGAFLEQYVRDTSYTAEDLSVESIGEFDGFSAVYVNGVPDYTGAYDSETVGGLTFLYVTGQHLLIYSGADRRLYALQEALDGGVLDEPALREVFEAHRAAEPLRYQEKEDVTEVSEQDIKRAYLEKYRIDPAKCRAEDLSVLSVGEFDGCQAVFINGPFAAATVITTETVDGLKFVYRTSQTLLIYRDGSIYRLAEAWEAGLIGRPALEALHRSFPGGTETKVM